MKRIPLVLLAVLVIEIACAQGITDGLIYSSESQIGTARFNALSGAFGALGGDFSAISINPAGGAVFLASSATFSVSGNDVDNRSTYFNTTTKSIDTDINLNQAGGIFVFNFGSENSKLKKFTIAFNYQVEKNYNNELIIKGIGNNSIGDFFLSQAQGIPLELLQLQSGESISSLYSYLGENEGTSAQNAFLGYQGFIIDPIDGGNSENDQYVSNISPGIFNQDYAYLTHGTKNKYTVNLGAQVNNNIFLGINLNTHSLSYHRNTFLLENNSNPGSLVNEVGFENNLSVRGFGLSAQLGIIAKIQNNFRLGLSLQSPTWYDMFEETTQFLQTRRVESGRPTVETINPQVINVFQNYSLLTPGKVTASAAYIFGNNGLISFDYSFKDYGSIRFDTYNYYNSYNNDNYFNSVNNTIKNSLNGVNSLRLGGEYRINQLSLRGGIRYEDSPYKNDDIIGDLNGFSLGLGYNLGNYNIDISYARAEQDRKQQLYSAGLTDSASITTVTSSIIFTLGFAL
jgi:long-subunit fatty acid transport protein